MEVSEYPGIDAQLLLERILLNFLLGNGDAHLKNYSILEDASGKLRLSPAYDIVCRKLVILDEEDSALTINGKRNKISMGDFEKLSEYLQIPDKAAADIFKRMSAAKDISGEEIDRSLLKDGDKEMFRDIIEDRHTRIYPT